MNKEIPVKEGFVSFRGYQVWYRVVGDQEGPGKLPLLCLHGGPGATHDYLEPFNLTMGQFRVPHLMEFTQGESGSVTPPVNSTRHLKPWRMGLPVSGLQD